MSWLSTLIKLLVSTLIMRSILRLRIDHALWMVINMIQVIRTATLFNLNFGLVLRDFLNDNLGGFMTQININLLPKILFRGDTELDRKFQLYGIESYIFLYYFITSMIVLFGVLFMFTFGLAVLECMKTTKSRLKLMIAIATYLSYNLWIRGFFHFSLTLIMGIANEIKHTYQDPVSIISITSKIVIFVWLILMILIIRCMFKLFSKKSDPK